MTVPSIPFCLLCEPEFRRPARYTIVMLGMIAGFKPIFTDEPHQAVVYGPGSRHGDAASDSLPASDSAQRFLLSRGTLERGAAQDQSFEGFGFLSLFPVAGDDTEERGLRSDIIAAAFFFLSFHEEWNSDHRDTFDRFLSKDSLLGALGMQERPVVAEYARVLRAFLERHAGLAEETRSVDDRPVVCLTHDIDYMSKFTPGLLYREAVTYLLRNALRMPVGKRLRRFREYLSYARAGRDPYLVSIDRILEETGKRGFRSTFFLKPGQTDKRDARMNLRSPRLSGRIARMLESGHDVGVHPSFMTYLSPTLISAEKRLLEETLARPVRSVRQHYLRFRYPDTWRHQIGAGLTVDSTAGYAEREGFRNGACHPFLPYDLERGVVMPIWEVPLTVMDGTLASYRNMDPVHSLERIRQLFGTLRSVRGVFVALFHNTCYDAHDFPGWDNVFETFLDECLAANALAIPLPEAVERWHRRAGYMETREIVDLVDCGD